MRNSILITLLLSAFSLTACDLRHLPEKIGCWQAKDDRSACLALHDSCMWLEGSMCRGGDESVCATACRPSDDRSSCTIAPRNERACGSGGLVTQRGVFKGPKHESAWKYWPLDRSLWEPRVGAAFDPAMIASMTDRERRSVCATTWSGDVSGQSPCVLEWDAEAGHAFCESLPEPCVECDLIVDEEAHCISKNLCNGVICF